MAESIDTYKNLTTYLHKNTSTEKIDYHLPQVITVTYICGSRIFFQGVGIFEFFKGGGGSKAYFQ